MNHSSLRTHRLVSTLLVIAIVTGSIACCSACKKKVTENDGSTNTSDVTTLSDTTVTTTTQGESVTEEPSSLSETTETSITATPSPEPTDTPTPVPTETPEPTNTPVPPETTEPEDTTRDTEPTEETKAPTPTPEPAPTDPPPPPPPEDTPTPTPTPVPSGRDLDAEFYAGISRLEELGYTITFSRIDDHRIQFTNATGTYKGRAYPMRGDAKWNFDYEPVDPNDVGATYKYKDSSDNLIAMINNIDPAWLNY